MALDNVFFLPSDPDSGPTFFRGLLALMLVIFSVVRQRDATVRREIDECHFTTSMRLHTQRWERMLGMSPRNRIRVDGSKITRLVVWWSCAGLISTLISLVLHSGLSRWWLALSAVGLADASVLLVLLALLEAQVAAAAAEQTGEKDWDRAPE